jgi:D-alanyl-D-alanine carboxypeptidase
MRYSVLATARDNDVRRVCRKKGGWTLNRSEATRTKFVFKKTAVKAANWGRARGFVVEVTKKKYPFIVLDDDTKMVRRPLAKKINAVGEEMRRYVWMGEGWRTNARQWQLWNEYVARGKQPPIVAYPGTSNHESGNAADVSLFLHGRDKPYVNFQLIDQVVAICNRLGLRFTVPGEPWHVED